MKKLLFIATACSILFTACKKSDSASPSNSSIPSDGWKLGTNQYKQVYCLRQSGQFALNCVDGTTGTIHSFAAFFNAYPTANGTYHIVPIATTSGSTYPGQNIGANDIIITGSIPTGSGGSNSYWSTGAESKDATVTISGGKIKIEVPEISVAYNTDTLKITGTMVEN